jgi:teichuronic acid biosynthesis glycosyltransferase TuaC
MAAETGLTGQGSRRLRLLSLSSVFPNPAEPELGIFVRSRLEHMSRDAEIIVIAPVPVVDYARINLRKFGWIGSKDIPRSRQDGSIQVMHSRWLYPPRAGALNPIFQFVALRNSVARIRKQFAFDLIDAHFGHPEGATAAMLACEFGVPYTITLRGNETMHGRWRWRRKAMAWALSRAARVIAVSGSLGQYAVSLGANPKKVKVIPNGIDVEKFWPRNRQAARSEFGFDSRLVVLSVGSLIERKGHHRTVAALKTIRDRGISAMVVIAGGPGREGNYEPAIRRAVDDLGLQDSVKFLGHIDNQRLPQLMSAADVLCLASTREGWPNVVHEALGCGTPVVATDVGGVRDMVPQHESGFVVPPSDQEALNWALVEALQRSWDRTAISNRARARSWRQVACEVLGEMQEIISERQASSAKAHRV